MNARRVVGAGILGVVLAGCGGSTPTFSLSSANLALVRFADEAPGAPNPSANNNLLTTTAVLVDGNAVGSIQGPPTTTNVSGVPSGAAASVTGYVALSPGSHAVSFASTAFGTVIQPALGPYTMSLAAGGRYTVVLAGTFCQSTSSAASPPPAFDNLQLMTFTDQPAASGATIEVYNAAPTVAKSINVGVFAATNPAGPTQSLGTIGVGQSLVAPVPSALAAGFGVSVVPGGSASTQTLAPVQVNANDPANALPLNVSTTFAVFVADTAQNLKCAGNFPPNDTAPSVNGTLGV